MAEDRKKSSRGHQICMEEREKITMTGVIDMLSFDEESIIVDTEAGMLILRGTSLHVGKLNLEDGELCIDGMIDSLEYSETLQFGRGKGSFWNKILK